MELFYIWLSVGLIFLLVEFFTATTYGLGLAIGAFITSLYVHMRGIEGFEFSQYIIFAIVVIPLVIAFPKMFTKNISNTPVGPDMYIGQTAELFKNGNVWKVKFEGVEYPVTSDEKRWFRNGKEAKITANNGGTLYVDKLPKIDDAK